MKYKNKIRVTALAGLTLAMAACSDFSDYNATPDIADANATKTIWENIKADATLSDFAAVLERVGYDTILNQPQAYTVWAPVNGSFNKDSLANVTDEKVIKEFVNNHIASFIHREADVNDTIIYMLNGKLLKFNNKNTSELEFDGQALNLNTAVNTASVYNHPSTNGVLYSLSGPAQFRMNLYDYMYELEGISDSLSNMIKRYDIKILDEANSTKGAIVDGKQTYDDEVYVYGNRLFCSYKLNGITYRSRYQSKLNDEDSTYMMIVPTNEAWKTVREKMESYYKYAASVDYQDLQHKDVVNEVGGKMRQGKNRAKLMPATDGKVNVPLKADAVDAAGYWTDSLITRFLTKDLVYSLNNKRYNSKLNEESTEIGNDSIVNTIGTYHTGVDSLRKATDEVVKLSNGYARIVHDFPFQSWESTSFAPVVKVLRLGRCYPAGSYEKKVVRKSLIDPSICTLDDNETYMEYYKQKPKDGDNSTPIEFDFYLDDVLSTSYNAYLVTVPECLENPRVEKKKDYSLYVDVNYIDETGKQVAGRFDPVENTIVTSGTSRLEKIAPIIASGEKVDTVFLGTITFGTCYKGLRNSEKEASNNSVAPNIKVMHTSKNFESDPSQNEYDHQLRVANVILRPVEYDEYKSSKNQ